MKGNRMQKGKGLVEQVEETIHQYQMLRPGDRVLVALSGGPDSLALLHILNKLKERMSFELQAAHLDHGLRGEESQAEARWVAAQCEAWGIFCRMGYWDGKQACQKGVGPEAAARQARLSFLQATMEKLGANVIAQGHHADDQAETILIRLLNGAGSAGLGGIKPIRQPYIRPLIKSSRQQILAYCREQGLEPREDSSNYNELYLRNKIRHKLMPILKTYNPNLVGTLTRTAELLQSEDEYLQHLAAEELAKISRKTAPDAQEFVINTQGLIELNPVLGRRVIRQWVGSELDYAGIQRIWELACRGRTGAIAELPGARQVHKNYTELVLSNQRKQLDPISKDTKKANLGWPVIINGLLELPQYKLHLRTVVVPKQKGQLIAEKGKCSPEQGQTNCYLAWDLTQGIPVLRQRQPGDWIQFPFGKKKLKQWLIDQKIPLIERDQLLILAWGQQILWIPGLLFGQSPFGERQAETYLHLTIQSSVTNDM